MPRMPDENEVDRRLADAAARAPAVAQMLLAQDRDPLWPRIRRLAIVVIGLAAGVGTAWAIVSWAGPLRGPAREVPEEIDTADYLAPLRTTAGPGGEEVAPFDGFAVSVETDPPGALVEVAGVPRGEAPVLAGIECRPGASVSVRAELAGRPPAVVKTACREDTLVKLTLRLAE